GRAEGDAEQDLQHRGRHHHPAGDPVADQRRQERRGEDDQQHPQRLRRLPLHGALLKPPCRLPVGGTLCSAAAGPRVRHAPAPERPSSSPACENRAVGDLSGHAPHGSPERPSGIREPTAPARETPVPPDDRTVLPRPPPTGRGPRTGAGPLIADEGSAHQRTPVLPAAPPPIPPRTRPPPAAP